MPDRTSEAVTQRSLLGRASHRLRGGKPKEVDHQHWLVVTIDRTPDEVAPGGQLPTMLTELGMPQRSTSGRPRDGCVPAVFRP